MTGQREPALGLERAQAHEPGRRLLGAAEQPASSSGRAAWSDGQQVGAVVERDLRRARRRRATTPARRRRRPRRGGVHLAAVARASAAATSSCVDSGLAAHERDLGAAGDQRAHEVRRLGRDVQARADAQPVERPLAREPLADRAQDGHLPVRPLDPRLAGVGQARVGDGRA